MPSSPAEAPELATIRPQIDALDSQIIELIGQRQALVEAAGRAKANHAPVASAADAESAVRAPARVEQVITTVRARAAEAGASEDVVEAVYRAMIAAFINHEFVVHKTASDAADVSTESEAVAH